MATGCLQTMAALKNGFKIFKTINYLNLCRQSSSLLISHVIKNPDLKKPITIQGWVTSMRKMKDLVFVDLNDGSNSRNLQVVLSKELKPALLTTGSSLEAHGTLSTNKNGQLELQAEQVKLLGSLEQSTFPFSSKQKHNHEYCRQHLSLRPQLAHFRSLLRVRHRALQAINKWYDEHDFLAIHTPILTSNDCEGAGEVFKVLPVNTSLISEMKKSGQSDDNAFFGNSAFLSVSGQLHLEAVTRGVKKVYSISPTFRAENSKSRLHLSEFYMVESEEAFVTSLDSVLDTIENLLKFIIHEIMNKCNEDLELMCKYDSRETKSHLSHLEKIVDNKFHRIQFEEAVKILKSNDKFINSNCDVVGLTKEQELFLVEKFNQTPVFVIDWPSKMKPFYMKNTTYSENTVSAVDLLVPNVGELCGGSLREDNFETLEARLKAANLLESMQWYLDLRKYGNVPTGGFGMGFERLLQLVTGLSNIKDTIPFPRWPHSLKM